MLTAPLLHARTANNDFPSSLLVVPQDFTDKDAAWARKYITQSTRYMELAGKEGRRLIFCSETLLVTGLSINIRDLYAHCGVPPKYDTVDDPNRTNYAFIGLVIPKSEIRAPFDVPYSVFLEVYEAQMARLWDLPFSEDGLTAARAPYQNMDFPDAAEIFRFDEPSNKDRYVLDANCAPLDSIAAGAVKLMLNPKRKQFAFCSNIPSVNNVLDGDLRIVTSCRAQKVLRDLEQLAAREKAEKHPLKNLPRISLSEIPGKLRDGWSRIPGGVKTTIFAIGSAVVTYIFSPKNNSKK